MTQDQRAAFLYKPDHHFDDFLFSVGIHNAPRKRRVPRGSVLGYLNFNERLRATSSKQKPDGGWQ